MPAYARIGDGIVAELFTTPDGVDITNCFAPGLQWIQAQPGVMPGWTFDGTKFAAPIPPPPTAGQVLAQKIAAGITITCTGTPAISATYALDAETMGEIGPVARDEASGIGLPGNMTTFTYPDITRTPRTCTGPQIVAIYKAMRDLLLALNTQAAVMRMGGTPAWPPQTATIA